LCHNTPSKLWAFVAVARTSYRSQSHFEIIRGTLDEVNMQNWKRAVIFGSLGAGTFFLITGRRQAGVVLTAVGLATLASEYPEKLEALWRNAPYYLEKGNQWVSYGRPPG
jgi:hypothetical protein